MVDVPYAVEISLQNPKNEFESVNDDDTPEKDEIDGGDTSDDREYEDDDSSDESESEIRQYMIDRHEFYKDYVKRTKGFDIPPTWEWRSMLKPAYSADSEVNKHALNKYGKLIKVAIDEFNRKNKPTKLELEKVLKVNRNPNLELYYFTFLAKEVSSCETKTYQCQLFNSWFRSIGSKVVIFREKPKEVVEMGIPPCPPKKQKLDMSIPQTHDTPEDYMSDSSGHSRPETGTISTDDDDSDLELRSKLITYKKWVRRLEGFDLPFVPDYLGSGNGLYGAIVPYYSADFDDNIPDESLRGYDCLIYAIEDHNEKKNTKLELVKVLKLNVRYSMVTFYFTFSARDISTGETKIYQTKIYHTGLNDVGEIVMIFREKDSGERDPCLSDADLAKTYQYWRY